MASDMDELVRLLISEIQKQNPLLLLSLLTNGCDNVDFLMDSSSNLVNGDLERAMFLASASRRASLPLLSSLYSSPPLPGSAPAGLANVPALSLFPHDQKTFDAVSYNPIPSIVGSNVIPHGLADLYMCGWSQQPLMASSPSSKACSTLSSISESEVEFSSPHQQFFASAAAAAAAGNKDSSAQAAPQPGMTQLATPDELLPSPQGTQVPSTDSEDLAPETDGPKDGLAENSIGPQEGAEEPEKASRYQCKHCKKYFTRPSSLTTHMYTHTGEKPHECSFPGCQKRFSVLSNLRRHMKLHREPTIRGRRKSQYRHYYVGHPYQMFPIPSLPLPPHPFAMPHPFQLHDTAGMEFHPDPAFVGLQQQHHQPEPLVASAALTPLDGMSLYPDLQPLMLPATPQQPQPPNLEPNQVLASALDGSIGVRDLPLASCAPTPPLVSSPLSVSLPSDSSVVPTKLLCGYPQNLVAHPSWIDDRCQLGSAGDGNSLLAHSAGCYDIVGLGLQSDAPVLPQSLVPQPEAGCWDSGMLLRRFSTPAMCGTTVVHTYPPP